MLQGKIFKLNGKVQHYAWGGFEFIPSLIGMPNTKHQPFAEYWMGAHHSASSELETINGNLSLNHLVNEFPAEVIGEKTQRQFGELPYLFKILDVKDMLSIQVHPSKEEAEKGFEAEEKAGILLSSSRRNYKDKNHKPEVMVALSEFWLLHGFLKKDKLINIIRNIPEFTGFEQILEKQGYKGLYEHVMTLPQEKVNELLMPLVERELSKKHAGASAKDQPGWWVTKLYDDKEEIENIDRGVFSIYFFNIVKLNPGEAIFQAAGVPHAYLEGQNVELMANSDNVLRGGLTPKHIDVPELLKHTSFEGIEPDIIKGELHNGVEKNYPCPVADFGISKIGITQGKTYSSKASSLEIYIVTDGEMEIHNSNPLHLKKGEAAAILSGETYKISTSSRAEAYKAFVP